MNKLICIAFISLLFIGCISNNETSKIKVSTNVGNLPIHGEIDGEKLERYFPGVLDTIKDIRIVGSEKINLNPGNGIVVSILHNTGTFDQMIVCTHDKNLKLIESLYLGKATAFEKSSETLDYKIIGDNSLRFDLVNWGFVAKMDENEIDTIKHESFIISVSDQGEIIKE